MLKRFGLMALAAAVLVGCTSGDETALDQPATTETQPESSFTTGSGSSYGEAEARRLEEQRAAEAAAARAADALRNERVVYFEFDSAELTSRAREVIRAHADYLVANPGVRIRLEGHTDERGTREYNIALGERRAKSVERAMMLRGVAQNQINVISYGEESPVALEHTEDAWAKNRRVAINYR
ncbi:peptidoglycan-associated lipoprotein Pal [uncultured Abyssibacter sp.]|uniref:peptidoglycan-associated lipoprotein Pal n=1 Tax=uncultured Abyssibacter sp. TaxID=2320202 RepID=UPI0032B2860D